MPCGFHINQDDELIHITASQTVNPDDAQSTFDAVLAHPDFKANMPQLIDLRGIEVTFSDSEEATVRAYHSLKRFLIRDYRSKSTAHACVVVDDGLDQEAIAAIFYVTCQLPRTELFDSYEQALRWLIRHEVGGSIRMPTHQPADRSP